MINRLRLEAFQSLTNPSVEFPFNWTLVLYIRSRLLKYGSMSLDPLYIFSLARALTSSILQNIIHFTSPATNGGTMTGSLFFLIGFDAVFIDDIH